MAEHLSQSELDYPFKLLEYFNGFRVSKVTFWTTDKDFRLTSVFSLILERLTNCFSNNWVDFVLSDC